VGITRESVHAKYGKLAGTAMGESRTRFGMGRVYVDAAEEARRRGDRRVSTEYVALALLTDADSVTAQALGVSLDTARMTLQELDRNALASLGIEASFDGPFVRGRKKERLRLTPAAREVFTGLRREADGARLSIKHVLLALLRRERPDPAAELFDALGVDRAAVPERLGQL
jgi:ATP-dependent Clp protease ATP-binding subunit ClpA